MGQVRTHALGSHPGMCDGLGILEPRNTIGTGDLANERPNQKQFVFRAAHGFNDITGCAKWDSHINTDTPHTADPNSKCSSDATFYDLSNANADAYPPIEDTIVYATDYAHGDFAECN